MKIWGPDIYDAQWSDLKPHIPEMVDHGMRFIILKATMGLGDSDPAVLEDFTNTCIRHGLMHAFYGWIDPIYAIDQQIIRYAKLIQTFDPDWVGGDFEQWWRDWVAFNRAILHEIPMESVPRLTADAICAAGELYMRELVRVAGDRKVVLYTNIGFVGSFAPQAARWIKPDSASSPRVIQSLWDAAFLTNTPRQFETWTDLAAAIEALPMHTSTLSPLDWDLWQFISVWEPPNMDRIDLSIYRNEATFTNHLHGTSSTILPVSTAPIATVPDAPPPLSGDYLVTNCYVASVRAGPSMSAPVMRFIVVRDPDTGALQQPTFVKVCARQDGWCKISTEAEEWMGGSLLRAV